MHFVMLALGALLYMSMQYLAVYFGSRHDKGSLAYALLCMVFCLMVFVLHIYPGLAIYDPFVFQALRAVCSSFIGVTLVYFSRTIFDLRAIEKILRFMSWSMPAAVFALAAMSLATRTSAFVWAAFAIMASCAATVLVLSLAQIVKLRQYRDRKRKLVLVGFLALLLQGFWFIAYEGILNRGRTEWNFLLERPGLIVMAFFFAFALLDGSQREHRELVELKDSLERKVQERTVQLVEANNQKTMFFVNMAHETKTPLTLIANYLDQLIARHGLTHEARVMKRNVDKLIRDIVNILNIEALDHHKHVYDNEQVADLAGIARQRVELFGHLAEKRGIRVACEVPDRAFARIDPMAADIILNNLLDNAIKYNRAGGTVHVRLTVEDGACFLSVSDTGEGMEPEKIANIFDQFYQISRGKRSREGMGIGLHLVKKLVELSGGGIVAESEAGEGSCFRLWLNASDPASGEAVSAEVEDAQAPLDLEEDELRESELIEGRQTVMAGEDNRRMLAFLQEMVSRKYNFVYAEDGRRAMALLESGPKPDLIISDIMMDGMDGIEFLSALRAREENDGIPFIFLSAKAADEDRIAGLRGGAVDFIAKPFNAEELMAKVDSVLSADERKRRLFSAKAEERIRAFVMERGEPLDPPAPSENAGTLAANAYQISPREMEIINLIYKGYLYKEIADELKISLNTVETYRKRIFKKCGVQTKTDLLNAVFRGKVLSEAS